MRASKSGNRWLATGAISAILVLAALAWLAWSARRERPTLEADPTLLVEKAGEGDEGPSLVAHASAERAAFVPSSRTSIAGRAESVSVRVVDPEGRAIPGVTVGYGNPTLRKPRPLGPLSDSWTRTSAPSDEHGQASFELEPGTWVVVAAGKAPDWGYETCEPFLFTGDDESREVVLRLTPIERGNLVRGIVLGPEGAPRANAYLMFVWDDRGKARSISGSSEPDGTFQMFVEQAGARGDLLAHVYRDTWTPAVQRDVVAGTEGIELRMGEPDFVTLEVRDTSERVLEHFSATSSWMLAGHPIQDSPGPKREPGLPLRWARSPVPFFVHVDAYEYQRRWFGPFEPAEVGALLVVNVEPLARVRGSVRCAGQPLPEARVQMRVAETEEELDLELRWKHSRGWLGGPKTGEAGRFDFALMNSGRYELRASKIPEGEGLLGPLELDASRGADGLEIVIDRPPGAIEGMVKLPSGHGPDEIWLLVSERGFRMVSPDGSYRLPDLAAGPCSIQIVDGFDSDERDRDRWFSMSHGPTRAPDWLPVEPSFTVEVRSGETTRFDIDLAAPLPCQLAGRFLLGGGVPSLRDEDSLISYGSPDPDAVLDRGDPWDYVGATDLDDAGRFVLGAAEPGTYRLKIGDGHLVLLDLVTLGPGSLTWEHDVPVGSLRVLPADDARPFGGPSLLARWAGPGDLRIFARYPEQDETTGALTFATVPAGTVQLVTDGLNERRTLLECQVRAGETPEVRLPR